MKTFSTYILEEKGLAEKMEIVYYLSKRIKIFYDKSVIFKTELARMFLEYLNDAELDENLILTVTLLCNCKKVDNAQDLEKIHSYAKEGAAFLKTLGFDEKFCKMAEEVNRYSESYPREKESDIIELVDQFGAMLLDRPERQGFKSDEALVLLEHRNFKNKENIYLGEFIKFINYIEQFEICERTCIPVLRRLTKMHNNNNENLIQFIKSVVDGFEAKVDAVAFNKVKDEEKEVNQEESNNLDKKILESEETKKITYTTSSKALFSEETTRRILENLSYTEEIIKEDNNS